MHNGAALRLLLGKIQATIQATAAEPALAEYAQALGKSAELAAATTTALAGAAMKGQVDLFLANAAYYLDMLGQIVLAWLGLQQAQVAQRVLAGAAASDRDFYEGKLYACRYFFRYELPRAQRSAELLQRMDDTTLTVPLTAF